MANTYHQLTLDCSGEIHLESSQPGIKSGKNILALCSDHSEVLETIK